MASFVIKKETDGDYIECNTSKEKLLYVHRNANNFNSEIAKSYFQKKQENKMTMLNRYKTNLMARIQLTDEVKQLFNLTTQEGQEELFSVIDKGVAEGLEMVIQTNSVETLLNLAKSSKQAFDTSDSNFKAVDILIKNISEAASLLGGPQGNGLVALLNNYLNGGINLTGLNTELQNRLSIKNLEGKVVGFDNAALTTAAKSLSSIINSVQKGERISEESLQGYLRNIFSTGLGERLIAMGVARQVELGADEILDQILTGAKSVANAPKITYQEDYSSLTNQTFKADVQTDNFKINISDQGNSSFMISLGLSVKTYQSGGDKKVSLVSGKPFNQVLEALFPGGKYYVYNTLGLLPDTQDAYREMKKSIVLSYADNFLSGTGHGSDFAQYIVINGAVYPIYDILKKVVENTTGALTQEVDASDPVIISIRGASVLEKLRYSYGSPSEDSLVQAWERNREIHQIITGQLKVHGYLNIQKLKQI